VGSEMDGCGAAWRLRATDIAGEATAGLTGASALRNFPTAPVAVVELDCVAIVLVVDAEGEGALGAVPPADAAGAAVVECWRLCACASPARPALAVLGGWDGPAAAVSAAAIPQVAPMATPTPMTTARPPTRPT
jgi:hypothetical protein